MPKPAGAVIRKVRVSHGEKVRDLAKVVGIKPNSLTNIECGIKRASIEVLTRIANHYDVEVGGLIAADAAQNPVQAESSGVTR